MLTDALLVELVRRLLIAEARRARLPRGSLHVAKNLTAPDGEEDAGIAWSGEPERTTFLPGRLCQFQLKATDLAPRLAATAPFTKLGTLEPKVGAALAKRGHYILLCTHPYTMQAIQTRENRIRDSIRAAGVEFEDGQVQFRDASMIADWTNAHPVAAAWLTGNASWLTDVAILFPRSRRSRYTPNGLSAPRG